MDKCIDFLKKHHIEYERHDHEAVFTVAESEHLYTDIKGVHTKNLFLKNKDASRFFLYIIEGHKRADLKHIAQTVGEKKLFFGSPEEMYEILGVTPGSVSALCVINDINHRAEVLIDKEVWEGRQINAHPNDNIATFTFAHNNFKKIFTETGHQVQII